MSQATQQMQALLDQVLHSDCTRQRYALASIGYRAQLAGTTPIAFLRAYFYAEFQSDRRAATHLAAQAAPIEPAAPAETGPVKCGSCGRTFATQTALNGHGEARCQARLLRQPR